jgi:ribonuclease BN (tRNA processing enzyme)
MGVDVVVFDSGSPLPDPERAGPALAVVAEAGWVLVDCGRAATQRAIDAGLDLTAVGYLVEHAGARVAVSGDTAVCDGMRALGRNVDVLVHQALLTSRVSPEVLEWNAAAVGGLAAEVEPGILVLTHLMPAPRSVEHQQRYLDEVRTGGFAGSTLAAAAAARARAREDDAFAAHTPT